METQVPALKYNYVSSCTGMFSHNLWFFSIHFPYIEYCFQGDCHGVCQESDADQEVTSYAFIRSKVQARSQRFESTKAVAKVSSNQVWVGNGAQIGRSTMRDIQGCNREANHKIKNKEQARIVVGQKQKLVGSLNLLSRRTRNSA